MKAEGKGWVSDTLKKSTNHGFQVFCIYAIQALLALIVGGSVYNTLHDSLGHSIGLQSLEQGFDRTVFTDMLNQFPKAFAHVETWIIVLSMLYFFLAPLLHGGLLSSIHKKQYSFRALLKNGLEYYLPFVGFSILSLLISLLSLGIIWVSFFKIIGFPLDTFDSEKPFIHWIILLSIVSLTILLLIWAWNIACKHHYIDTGQFWASVKRGLHSFRNHLLKFFTLGAGLVGLHIIIMLLYTYIIRDWGATSWFLLAFTFLVQQGISLFRIFLRCIGYAGIDAIVSRNP